MAITGYAPSAISTRTRPFAAESSTRNPPGAHSPSPYPNPARPRIGRFRPIQGDLANVQEPSRLCRLRRFGRARRLHRAAAPCPRHHRPAAEAARRQDATREPHVSASAEADHTHTRNTMTRVADLLLTALAAVIWGTVYLVTTRWLPQGYPLTVSLIRALPAGLLLLAFVRELPKGVWLFRVLVLGGLNFSLFWWLLFISAYRLPGGVAATVN